MVRTRRVAQFITADVAQSQLELAADGQLPELKLEADSDTKQKKKRSAASNQWRLVLLICGSLTASTLMLFVGPGEETQSQSSLEIRARNRINEIYLGNEDEALAPYQQYLRQAQLAYTRGDRKAERFYYRKVLRLLRAEHLDRDPDKKGVTGMRYRSSDPNLRSDQDLEERLSVLLKSS